MLIFAETGENRDILSNMEIGIMQCNWKHEILVCNKLYKLLGGVVSDRNQVIGVER